MPSDALHCPHCRGPLTPTDVLEACTTTDPGTGLLRLSCPACGARAMVRLQDGRLELGTLPAPDGPFVPAATAEALDLFVRRDPAWVDCWLGKVYRRFPVDA
jgi:hypothetical protein